MIAYSISLSTEPQMPMLNPSTQKSKPSQSLQGTVQGSNGYSFLPLQAYEIMCMRGEGCNWVLRLTLCYHTENKHITG